MNLIFSFAPVLLFLAFLCLLDNFRLVQFKFFLLCLVWGMICTIAGYYLNNFLTNLLNQDFSILSRYISPVTEELLKASIIIFLVRRKRIGFMIDAAIYGFAVGTGFALMENLWYLVTSQSGFNLLIWIIRGFGTAIMHGGCTAFMAILLLAAISRTNKILSAVWPGLLLAMVLHSAFNHFPLSPLIQTLVVAVLSPALILFIFRIGNARLQQWLEIELSSEVELLSMIRKGALQSSKAGQYLLKLKSRFDSETMVDMYCYLSLYLELSLKAKRNLMLKENGFEIMVDLDTEGKLKELDQLKNRLGRIGEAALAPLIRMNYRNLWKLNQL